MAWTINYKGLTGYQDSIAVADETTYTVTQLIAAIKSDETGGAASTNIDGPDSITYGGCYDKLYVSRDASIELTALTGSDAIDQHLADGDEIICTPLDGTKGTANKRVRQQVKLGIAQMKRKALMSGSPSSEPFYRTNNTYEWDNLPTTYNTDGTINDNTNAGGLLPQRPWNTAVGVAGVDVSALTLSAGLIQRIYDDYFGYDSVDQAGGDTNDQTHYTAYFSGSPAYAPAPPTSTPTAITALSFTPAGGNAVGENRSITILGYFKPDVTGTWNFRIRSDDGSYLFLGTNAEVNDNFAPDNIILANAVVDNGGRHAAANASGNFYLEAGSYYYMYAIFGNDTGPGTAEFFYTKPGGSEDDDFTGLIFYNTATNGQ